MRYTMDKIGRPQDPVLDVPEEVGEEVLNRLSKEFRANGLVFPDDRSTARRVIDTIRDTDASGFLTILIGIWTIVALFLIFG